MAYEYTDADLAAVNAAITSGAQSVSFGNRTVTHYSLSDLLLLRAEIIRSLTATTTGRTYRYAVTSKGV